MSAPPFHRPFVSVLALSLLGSLAAQEAPPAAPAAAFAPGRMIEMRPGDKRPLLLKDNERNPYAKRSLEETQSAPEESNSEELRIRQRLGELRVTGRSQGPNGLRVLLGDIILEEGRVLPQLLPNQSESLRVVEISEDTVVLGWLDLETHELTGKTMQVAYDLTPSVGYALHGQPRDELADGAAPPRMGVLRVGQDRKKAEAGMAARRPAPEVPPKVFEAGQ